VIFALVSAAGNDLRRLIERNISKFGGFIGDNEKISVNDDITVPGVKILH